MLIDFILHAVVLVFIFPITAVEIKKRDISRSIFRPLSRKCLDFCVYANCNYGECVLDTDTCYASCVCPVNVTGRWCETKIEVSNVSLVRTFMPWTRRSGIKKDSRSVNRRKDDNVTESLNNTKNEIDVSFPDNFKSRKEIWLICKKNCSKENKCVDLYANGSYVCLDSSLKCSTNVQCKYGVCPNKTSDDDNSIAQCLCEFGFSGYLCDEKCTKDCGIHGECVVIDKRNNITECVCKQYYTGPQCSIKFQNETNNDIILSKHIFENKTFPGNFESRLSKWKECKDNCSFGGNCVDVNGYYVCSYESQMCARNFVCVYGRCSKSTNKQEAVWMKCLCYYGYSGTFCNERCTRDCGLHGTCQITDKKKNVIDCVCKFGYGGPYCSDKIVISEDNRDIFNHWYIIGTCIGIGVVLLVLSGILPYCLWKKRRIFVMKLIHYFQHYEDDDGKTYDAFISYKSSEMDQDFVLKQLYPKLEKEMGFKLCMHFRDFTPGDVIANNIIQAIEDSRRTIMVISKNYIESEWCRLEFQKAQHEMLKLKHRIIPIMLDDASNVKQDKNLKAILNSVTYIEWPGDSDSKKLEKFWKQLKLSMPKLQSSSSSSSDQIVSVMPSSEKSLNYSSFNSSNPSTFSSIPTIQTSDDSMSRDIESKNYNSSRVKTLLRNPFRLNITPGNFRKLSRAYSSDSGISSPITASPSSVSPLIKDHNPLLPRKPVDIRHNNSKGLTKHLQGPSHANIKNKNLNSNNVDIPDVCKTANDKTIGQSFNNITMSECDCVSLNSDKGHHSSVCNTCILNMEVDNEQVQGVDCRLKNDNHMNNALKKLLNNSKILNTSDRINTI